MGVLSFHLLTNCFSLREFSRSCLPLPFYFLIVRRVQTNNSTNFAIRNFIQTVSAHSLRAAKGRYTRSLSYLCFYNSTSATSAACILIRQFRACPLIRLSCRSTRVYAYFSSAECPSLFFEKMGHLNTREKKLGS